MPRIGSSATNWVIYDDDKILCRLSNKKYLSYKRPAGSTTFRIKTGGFLYSNKTYELKTYCGPGQTCFIKTNLESNGWKSWGVLEVASREEAIVDLYNLTQDNCMR